MRFSVLAFFRFRSVVATGHFAGCLFAGCLSACESSGETSEFVDWDTPADVEVPRGAEELRLVDVELGEHLFFSPLLSRDGSTSCASCHRPELAFSDGRVRSIGIDGNLTPRNSPSLLNSAWSNSLTWSNLALRDFESHAMVPLFGDSPPEMAASFDSNWLTSRLCNDVEFLRRLQRSDAARDCDGFTWPDVFIALANFQRSLHSFDAPWDRYEAGDVTALNDLETRGADLFFSAELACSECHPPPFFTVAQGNPTDLLPAPEHYFFNTGLIADNDVADPGLFEFTGLSKDWGKFRVPSLRNVEWTAPYMHDGSVDSLDAVIDHYAAGGRARLGEQNSDTGSVPTARVSNLDPRIRGFALSSSDRRALVAFLRSLSGDSARQIP